MLKVCRAEACQAVGAVAMADRLLARLGVEWHGTTQDGSLTVEPTFCLGLCASAPAIVVDDKLHARVTPERFDRLIGRLAVVA